MQFSLKRVAVSLGVAATIVGLGAANASAAGTWTAKIGTATSGSGTYTAASSGSVTLKDTTTGVVVTCTASTASGAVPVLGSGLSGTAIATITGTTWTSCTGAGLTFSVAQSGTWNINAASYAAPTVTGNLTNVKATLTASGCTFTVSGSTDGTYNNSTQVLTVAPVAGSGHVLTISGVSGCFGVVANGHTSSFNGAYKVAAKTSGGVAGALSITSP